jgi:solute carrier family 35, member F1/2
MVGLFGFLLSSLQVALLEYRRLALFQWTSISAWMFGLFTGSMVCFYSLVSLVMRRASALLFNISVLTSDFYSLLTGVFLFGNEVGGQTTFLSQKSGALG